MPVLKTVIFTILVPGFFGGVLPYLLGSSSGQGAGDAARGWRVLGLVPVALGALGYLWCAAEFALRGKGTPAPIDPPKLLVVKGLYRWVRNPMYVSVALVIVGETVWFGAPRLILYLAAFLVMTQLFVVLYEEPHLEKTFGAAYEAYLAAVPRWIPRIRPWNQDAGR